MALADWLNPATPQPTYLTSRAAGVVVPEFYKAASEVRKNALGLASDEQSLRLQAEEAQRKREEDLRRKQEEQATAAVMPTLTSLDPSKPSYFRDLTNALSQPGAANALASQTVRSFLDIASGARSETLRREEEQRDTTRRVEEEGRIAAREVAREERADARSSLEGAERLVQKYAEDLEDEDFLPAYSERINKIRETQKTKPTEVPGLLTKLTEDMTRDRNQRAIKNDLLKYGLTDEDIEKIKKEDGGKFGDRAKARLGVLRQQLTNKEILAAELRVIEDDIRATTSSAKKAELQTRRREIINEARMTGSVGPRDLGADYVNPPAGGGAGAARQGDGKAP